MSTDLDVFEELADILNQAGIAYNGEILYQLCMPIQQHLEQEAAE